MPSGGDPSFHQIESNVSLIATSKPKERKMQNHQSHRCRCFAFFICRFCVAPCWSALTGNQLRTKTPSVTTPDILSFLFDSIVNPERQWADQIDEAEILGRIMMKLASSCAETICFDLESNERNIQDSQIETNERRERERETKNINGINHKTRFRMNETKNNQQYNSNNHPEWQAYGNKARENGTKELVWGKRFLAHKIERNEKHKK